MKQRSKDPSEKSDHAPTALPEFTPYLINRIAHRYNQSVLENMTEHGITVPKMRALVALANHGELTVNEITVYAVSEQSTMSRTLDQMLKDGLVTRKVGEGDNRVRVVSLTKDGRDLYDRIWPHMHRAESELLKGLDDKKKAALLETLNSILDNIKVNDF